MFMLNTGLPPSGTSPVLSEQHAVQHMEVNSFAAELKLFMQEVRSELVQLKKQVTTELKNRELQKQIQEHESRIYNLFQDISGPRQVVDVDLDEILKAKRAPIQVVPIPPVKLLNPSTGVILAAKPLAPDEINYLEKSSLTTLSSPLQIADEPKAQQTGIPIAEPRKKRKLRQNRGRAARRHAKVFIASLTAKSVLLPGAESAGKMEGDTDKAVQDTGGSESAGHPDILVPDVSIDPPSTEPLALPLLAETRSKQATTTKIRTFCIKSKQKAQLSQMLVLPPSTKEDLCCHCLTH